MKAQAWTRDDPPAENRLGRVPSHETRSTHGQCLQAFCEWAAKTPEQLLEPRGQELKLDSGDDKSGTLNLLQSLIPKGTYADKRRGRECRLADVVQSSKRRGLFFIGARSFFIHDRLPLQDKEDR